MDRIMKLIMSVIFFNSTTCAFKQKKMALMFLFSLLMHVLTTLYLRYDVLIIHQRYNRGTAVVRK